MSFEDAVKLLMVSFDSTLKANLSWWVAPGHDGHPARRIIPSHERRIEAHDIYFQAVSNGWGEALKQAFHALPDYSFYGDYDLE